MGAFGTDFAPVMAFANYQDGDWSDVALKPVEELHLHPAAHVLHYASTCFEGLKAYRREDGSLYVFRLDRHVARLQRSTEFLCLPTPDAEAVFVSCGALRSVEVIDEIEAVVDKPVVTSNQAMLWHCLRLAGIDDRLDGMGRLTREH